MFTNASMNELEIALNNMNREQGYQIEFNRLEQVSNKRVAFTLKTKSKVSGARTSWNGRNLARASWHAHGYLFDELFKLRSDIYILSGINKITSGYGNWKDRNIGSIMSPCMYSDTSIL